MQKRIRHLYRTLAVATVILSLISYLLPPSGLVRGSALAKSVASSPAVALPALQGEPAVQQLKEQGLYDSLTEAVAAARYKLRWEDQPGLRGLPPAYHAPNPAQRFAAYFTPTELHLAALPADREAGRDSQAPAPAEWRAAMRFVGYGYGENLLPVEAFAELAALDNRIEYRRPTTPLTEWYVNKAEGLEQGFTLAAAPGTRAEGARLRLALEVTGDLRAELVEEGQAIALRHANGEMALRYGELHAYDANEQALPAQLRVEEGRVILEVEDGRAVYPVTIDPLLTQQQNLTASDGAANDQFGDSVAISGDTVVVGAHLNDFSNQGSAYVFVRSGGAWSQQQKLTASDGAHGDHFGSSVAINGDTAVVGAPQDDIGASAEQGAAYVFVGSGTKWSQQQQLTGNTAVIGDRFGWSVAISGNTVMVGAAHDDIGANSNQGSAYVFVCK